MSAQTKAVVGALSERHVAWLIPESVLPEAKLKDFAVGEVLDFLHWAAIRGWPISKQENAIVYRFLEHAHYYKADRKVIERPELANRRLALLRLFPPGSIGRGGW